RGRSSTRTNSSTWIDPGGPAMNRRDFFSFARDGIGATALAGLLLRDAPLRGSEAAGEARPPGPNFTPRAVRAIHICLVGALSHVDSFDYKPGLIKAHGKPLGA